MHVGETGRYAVVMVTPTFLVGVGLIVPRASRAVGRRIRRRRAGMALQPILPPIEQLAADLRRLLLRHETIRVSSDIAMKARHLRAVEAAIGDCAAQAAVALGLPCPERPAHGALTTSQLRVVLRALADAGLVLVPATGLLAPEAHG